jgi:hypothetical protein
LAAFFDATSIVIPPVYNPYVRTSLHFTSLHFRTLGPPALVAQLIDKVLLAVLLLPAASVNPPAATQTVPATLLSILSNVTV